MRIIPYAENKRGDRVYMDYVDGKPISFNSIEAMMEFFHKHNMANEAHNYRYKITE